MQIQGQAALVTGGASGLGEATARELARLGAKVAVLDRNAELAKKVAADIGGVACPCDITDAASVTAALEKAAAAHGPARILMNVAGIGSAIASRRAEGGARSPAKRKTGWEQRAEKGAEIIREAGHEGILPFGDDAEPAPAGAATAGVADSAAMKEESNHDRAR